jgi:hypothetical protein
MTNQIFQTQNTALAVTLATLGVPFAQTENGHPAPFLNIYDPACLRKLGYTGWNLQEAAADAHAKGRPGNVHYQFQRTPTLETVVSAYNARHYQIVAADFSTPPEEIDIPPALAAKFACQLLKNRGDLIAGWKTAVPMLAIPGDTHTASDPERAGGKIITGSCKLVSLNASAATKARLGL